MKTTSEQREELRRKAMAATPICTELLGDRYFGSDYSCAQLTKAQDAYIESTNPQTVLALLDDLGEMREALTDLIGAIKFAPLGVTALKAMERAGKVLVPEDIHAHDAQTIENLQADMAERKKT